MPRGIYDRSKIKSDKPTAKQAEVKKVPRKMRVARSSPVRAVRSIPGTGQSELFQRGNVASELPAKQPETKPYFVIGDGQGLHVFTSVDDAVRYMVGNGASAETIGGDVSTRILELHMHQEPEPKNVRLTYTL